METPNTRDLDLRFLQELPYNVRLFYDDSSRLRGKLKMSHAVIRAGGKQFLVEEGQTIRVPSIEADAGSSIELETLLSSGDGKISATVVAHGKDQKIVVFKKKRRKQYKRTRGHRQGYTTLKIDSIG
jgi:large subunit ribosomal protein L21